MKKESYLAKYNLKKDSKLNKSSSASIIAENYVPKERWKSKLKRKMILKHVLENDPDSKKASPQRNVRSPPTRGKFACHALSGL